MITQLSVVLSPFLVATEDVSSTSWTVPPLCAAQIINFPVSGLLLEDDADPAFVYLEINGLNAGVLEIASRFPNLQNIFTQQLILLPGTVITGQVQGTPGEFNITYGLTVQVWGVGEDEFFAIEAAGFVSLL